MRKEARRRYIGRQTMEMVPCTWEKKKRKTEAEMDGLCQPMRAIGTTKDEVHDRTGWGRIVSAASTLQLSGSG